MIFFTFGTIPYSFNRMVDWIEALLNLQNFQESIFIQYGVTDISRIENHPLVEAKNFLSEVEMFHMIAQSKMVIAHAGQGTTIKLAATNKPFIIVPRDPKYKEHIDKHQLEFAMTVSQEFGIYYCDSWDKFTQALHNPPTPINKELFNRPKLANHLLSLIPAERTYYNSQYNHYTKVL